MQKREQLARILRERAGTRYRPLSFAQQRLWFVDLLDPGNPAYNTKRIFRVRGPLNPDLLTSCIDTLIDRHETLRTTFAVQGDAETNGEPKQVIAATGTASVVREDLSGATPGDDRSAAILQDFVRQRLDLRQGPLFKVLVARTGPDEHLLVFLVHHIVCDGWSYRVLGRELHQLYETGAKSSPALPKLTIQYGDYTEWQRSQAEAFRTQAHYWINLLGRGNSLLALPIDRSRPSLQSTDGDWLDVVIPGEKRDGLQAIGRPMGATLFMTLLAAFAVLLFRYTGQNPVRIGTTTAGRTRRETEGLIGLFVNSLVVQADFTDKPTFRQIVARIREASLDAYGHQDVPFERLVELMNIPRNLAYHPIFQVGFELESDAEILSLPGAHIEELPANNRTSKLDLTLFLKDEPRGLRGYFEYSTAIFDPGTIERLHAHLQAVLEAVTARPDIPVDAIPLLSTQERDTILNAWNATDWQPPHRMAISEMFEQTARQRPDAVAVQCGSQIVNYQELNRWSDQLARFLESIGVGPEVRVGIFLERGPGWIASELAVLKAGGAFVPLDPSHPDDRIHSQIAHSETAHVLTSSELEHRLPDRARTVRVDAFRSRREPAEIPATHSASRAARNRLAYVLYTSGTTGRPKGVMVSEESLSLSTLARLRYYQRHPGRFLMVYPFAFDSSIAGIYWTLCVAGGTLVIADEREYRDVSRVAGLLGEMQITHLDCVPTLYAALLDEAGDAHLRSLQVVVVGGEACPQSVVAKHRERLPNVELHNEYGPTESTVWCSVQQFAAREAAVVTVGKPIANAQVYILDSTLEPVPPGLVGEIYVAGIGLARGYLADPESTAAAFLPNPFSKMAGARLYRTGDTGRYRADGTIEYIGRADHQVKIRGFRVELGEIESVLRSYPGVKNAVVDALDNSGESQLVAYFVTSSADVTGTRLKDFVRSRLPEYMVPVAFVALERMPVSPNGKVDRAALPRERVFEPRDVVLPRTPLEQQIADIFALLLGVQRVGVHESFFDLGGHSLLAAKLLSRIDNTVGVKLSLQRVFEAPTVEGLACAILESQMTSDPENLERILKELDQRSGK